MEHNLIQSNELKQYGWVPQEDIAAWELTQALPILLYAQHSPFSVGRLVENLPEDVKRHFEGVE